MMLGKNTSAIQILALDQHGFSLVVDGEELFVGFADFPWFDGVPLAQLREVQRPAQGHLYWPSLDIDLSVESIRNPAAFPLVAAR